MDDHLKQLGVAAGIGAAIGVGLALGLGLRILATSALVGIGAGAAIGLATAARGRDGPRPAALSGQSYAALH